MKKSTKTNAKVIKSKAKPKAAPKAKAVKKKVEASPVEKAAAAKVNKKQTIIDMLSREEGATIKQLMEATSWQRHSLHGQMATLRKKANLKISSTKEADGDAVYRIA